MYDQGQHCHAVAQRTWPWSYMARVLFASTDSSISHQCATDTAESMLTHTGHRHLQPQSKSRSCRVSVPENAGNKQKCTYSIRSFVRFAITDANKSLHKRTCGQQPRCIYSLCAQTMHHGDCTQPNAPRLQEGHAWQRCLQRMHPVGTTASLGSAVRPGAVSW